MDGNDETTISQVKIWNHPTETAIYKLFRVPGDAIRDLLIPQLEVTIRPLMGHVNFFIPKRARELAELPGTPWIGEKVRES